MLNISSGAINECVANDACDSLRDQSNDNDSKNPPPRLLALRYTQKVFFQRHQGAVLDRVIPHDPLAPSRTAPTRPLQMSTGPSTLHPTGIQNPGNRQVLLPRPTYIQTASPRPPLQRRPLPETVRCPSMDALPARKERKSNKKRSPAEIAAS